MIEDTALTQGDTATTSTQWTLGFLAVRGITSYATWTDDRYGDPEVLFQVINPDRDSDGLADAADPSCIVVD